MTTNSLALDDSHLSPISVVNSLGPVWLCWALLWSLWGKSGFQNSFPSPVFSSREQQCIQSSCFRSDFCFRLPWLYQTLWIMQDNLYFKVSWLVHLSSKYLLPWCYTTTGMTPEALGPNRDSSSQKGTPKCSLNFYWFFTVHLCQFLYLLHPSSSTLSFTH